MDALSGRLGACTKTLVIYFNINVHAGNSSCADYTLMEIDVRKGEKSTELLGGGGFCCVCLCVYVLWMTDGASISGICVFAP